MIVVFISLFIGIILIILELYIIRKNNTKKNLIPLIVFFISTLSYIYMQIQGVHFILSGNETNIVEKAFNVLAEFIVTNILTIILYLIAKRPKYTFLSIFFVTILSATWFLNFSVNKPILENENYFNSNFVAKKITDTQAIHNAVTACYFEGSNYAGYNSYPLNSAPSLRIVYDVLKLSEMDFFNLEKVDIKNISIALEDTKKNTFYDTYLYYKSMILLGQTSDIGLERFINSHYCEDSKFFFENNKEDSLMNKLTATLYCVELSYQAGITLPNENAIKENLIELLKKDTLFAFPEDIKDCYESVLKEPGTILRILSLFEKTDDLLQEVSKRKEWFESITKIVLSNDENLYSQMELWIRNDMTEINNNFYNIDMDENIAFLQQYFSQLEYNHVGFGTETFLHDSQYIHDLAQLSYYYYNDFVFDKFVQSYIEHNISTFFSQHQQTELLARDTFYGVSIAKNFNIRVNNEKIIVIATDWINAFIESQENSLYLNVNALYAIKTLKVLNVNFESSQKEILQETINKKLSNNKFRVIKTGEIYSSLHEAALLIEMQSEIDETYKKQLREQLSPLILEVTNEDLSVENFNIAYDVLKIIDINDPAYSTYIDLLHTEIDNKLKKLYQSFDKEKSATVLELLYQINGIAEIIGCSESIDKQIDEIQSKLKQIYINDLSIGFYMINSQD